MKKLRFNFLILLLPCLLFSSCLWDEEIVLSSNANFVSLRFGKNDSVPALQTAAFTLQFDSLLNDSVIANLDSLPFRTPIDSVYPTFTFVSSSRMQLIKRNVSGAKLDTITLTGNDTVDFNKVVSVRNIAADGKTTKTYPVKVNVHTVEPELYVWRKLTDRIYTHSGSEQKAVFFGGRFLFFVSSGVKNYVYSSQNATQWVELTLTGLPENPRLRNIVAFNNRLFLAHENGQIYSTSNGTTWSVVSTGPVGFQVVSLLFALENNLWAVAKKQNENAWHFALSTDGTQWSVGESIPQQFPVGDFAALSFHSRTNKPRGLVVGGFSTTGQILARTWSVERNVFQVYRWVDFGIENTTHVPLTGASVIAYDNKLLLFGGMDLNNNVIETPFMESIDEGLTWRAIDSRFNVIFDSIAGVKYTPRGYQSIVLDPSNHRIYLFGGRSGNENLFTLFSDVWTGKLNRRSFLRQ